MTLLEEVKSYKEEGVLRFGLPNIIARFREIAEEWELLCKSGSLNDKELLEEIANEIIFLLENGSR